jgi:competence protein ComEC
MAAVTLSAQMLTFPVCIYYFHQFPTMFLLVNLVAVPLSSLILYTEIILMALAWIPFAGIYTSKAITWLVWLMNTIIRWVNRFSLAVWDMIPATVISTWLLYAVVIGLCSWLLSRNKRALQFSLFCLLLFTLLHVRYKWERNNQQKLIVYNVPQHQAIDIINGRSYHFIGDSILLQDAVLQNFHLKPARIALQLYNREDTLDEFFQQAPYCQYGNKKILLIDRSIAFEALSQKIDVDMIIISKNPRLYIPQLEQVFNCKQYIFDASNSLWKIAKWQKDCEALHLQCYSIPEQGAFVTDL